MTIKGALLSVAAAVGLEDEARAVRRLVLPRSERRNRLDDDALALLLALWLPSDANCIDIGAHRGTVLRELVRLAPGGRHVAYEPLPELAQELRRNFPSVEVRERAVADAQGRHLFLRAARSARSGLEDVGEKYVATIEVAVERLDDAIDPTTPPSFIKVDVEGAELDVFRGAAETLSRYPVTLAFEHGAAGRATSSPSHELYELLTECGLRIFDMDGRGPYTGDAFENAERWNFIAHR